MLLDLYGDSLPPAFFFATKRGCSNLAKEVMENTTYDQAIWNISGVWTMIHEGFSGSDMIRYLDSTIWDSEGKIVRLKPALVPNEIRSYKFHLKCEFLMAGAKIFEALELMLSRLKNGRV